MDVEECGIGKLIPAGMWKLDQELTSGREMTSCVSWNLEGHAVSLTLGTLVVGFEIPLKDN